MVLPNEIILSPYYYKGLMAKKSSRFSTTDEIYFWLLFYDKLILYKNFVDERNYMTVESLIEQGLASFMPDGYLKKSLEDMHTFISKFDEIRIREYDILDLNRIEPLDVNEDELARHYSGVNKQTEDLLLDNWLSESYIEMVLNQIEELKEFIIMFRQKATPISKELQTGFSYMYCPFNFITAINWSLPFNTEELRLLRTRTFTTIEDCDFLNIYEHAPKHYYEKFVELIEAKIYLDAGINYSIENGATIKTPKISQNNLKNLPGISQFNESKNLSKIYKILISDINFPRMSNLDDVLRLREHKHIKEFKNRVSEWNRALQLNDFKAEEELRNYLYKANQSLTTLEIQKKKHLEWYIEIPLSLIEVALHLPISLILSSYSGWIRLKEAYTKRKYRWLLLN